MKVNELRYFKDIQIAVQQKNKCTQEMHASSQLLSNLRLFLARVLKAYY